jgi:hypothetical protein
MATAITASTTTSTAIAEKMSQHTVVVFNFKFLFHHPLWQTYIATGRIYIS